MDLGTGQLLIFLGIEGTELTACVVLSVWFKSRTMTTSKSNHRKLKSIREVILEPKHETPSEVIKAMLQQSGFEEVRVLKSKATYR